MSRRPFAAVLSDLAGGALPDDLDAKLAAVVEAVTTNHGKGELTLTLAVKPNGEQSVEIVSTVKTKLPDPERPRTMMFVDGSFGLTRRDPRQSEMELRSVTPIADTQPAKTEE